MDERRVKLKVGPAKFSQLSFVEVLEKWTKEPELVIPPVKAARIISSHDWIRKEEDNKKFQQKTTLRVLVPKRPNKDKEQEELVTIEIHDNSNTFYSLVLLMLTIIIDLMFLFFLKNV